MEITRGLELNQNQNYVVRVRAVNSFNVPSNWSDAIVINGTDVTFDINRPRGLQVVAAIRSLVLTWTASTDVQFSHYEIYVKNTPFSGIVEPAYKYGDFYGTVATIKRVWNADLATPAWEDLTPGTTYYVVMRSVSKTGTYSTYSFEQSATTGYVGDADLVVDSISGNKIQVDSLAADKITTGTLTASIAIAGSFYTSTTGARVEIDTEGIRGYDQTGATPNFDYSTDTGDVIVRGDIIASGYYGDTLNLHDEYNWKLDTAAATTTELMPNGNFDTDASGWVAVSGCSLLHETTTVNTGAGAMRITSTSGGEMIFGTPTGTSGIAINPRSAYTLSYATRAAVTGRTFFVGVRFYDEDGAQIGTEVVEDEGGDASGSWGTTTYTVSPPLKAAYIALRFHVYSTAASEVHYIDSVSLKESVRNWNTNLSDMYSYVWDFGATELVQSATLSASGRKFFMSRDTATYWSTPASCSITSGVFFFGYEPVGIGTWIEASTNRAYRVTLRMKSDPDLMNIVGMAEFDSDGNYISGSAKYGIAVYLTSTFKQFTYTFRTEKTNVAYVKFFMFHEAPEASHTVWADDLIVQAMPYVDGGYQLPDAINSRGNVWDRTGYLVPPGTVILWGGVYGSGAYSYEESQWEGERIAGYPAGWVPCDGRTLQIATWPRLYAAVRNTYGGSAGAGTFAVPNLTSRYWMGVASITDTPSLDSGTLGHSHTLNNHTHNIDHSHGYYKTNPDYFTNTANANSANSGGPSNNNTSNESAGTLSRFRGIPLMKG